MRESFWGVFIITTGVVLVGLIYFFQNVTNTDEHNYTLLKETTQNAMYDAFDLAEYRATGTVKINREKFVENFIRRFAENAQLSNTYEINFYDIVETGIHTAKNIKKAEAIEKSGGLPGKEKDAIQEYEDKMLQFSKDAVAQSAEGNK